MIALSLLVAIAVCADETLDALERDLTRLQEAPRKTPAYERNVPIAMLALKKARMLEGQNAQWYGGQDLQKAILTQGQAAIQRARQGSQPVAAPGRLNELAYITANDGTVQPYYLYLPPDFTPKRRWPLITFLHGYVPTTSFIEPWVPSESVCQIAGKHGAILLIPYGRRNTDFQGVGEEDVLASIAEVCKYFPVDPDRLYLSGVSMGGMGAWNLALRHPGMFAAVTPMCGQTDMFLWWGWPRDDVPIWKRWLVEWDNAADQVPNLRNQNIFVQHGELDTLVPAQQTRLMIEAGEKQGTPIKSYFFPGESHFIYFRDDAYDNAWGWQKQFKLDRSPRRVDFKAYSLEYNRAYWLTIDEFEHWFTPAEVTAELSADGKTLTIRSTNISRLTINLTDLKSTDPQVKWNDQTVKGTIKDNFLTLSLPGSSPVSQASGSPPFREGLGAGRLSGLRKTRGLCGPCEEVLDTRFLLVQGTSGTADQKTALAAQVAQWSADWDAFADGFPPVKTDAEVADQDLQSANLILFGTPETNSLLAKIAPSLPIKIGDHRYELAGRVYEGPDLGLVMCYPNPLNPSHYVLIYTGEPYGEKLSINHKHDLLPDFLIFTTKSCGRDDTNDALCAGFFDMDWQPKPNLTWQTNQP